MRRVALALAALVLLTLPYWIGGPYYVNIASQVLIWAIFALGLNVLVGYGGLVSLGHAGLFGTAAYAAAWLVGSGGGAARRRPGRASCSPSWMSALYAALALSATGIGFLLITLALGQILWEHCLSLDIA